ncbi:ATPase [Peribacillus muralis]|uniref:ATPase n=1 Tax=Peribacillus muralis TaxID=264697 RepID=A0A1B3XK07_9BACI|nr:ABC transporter ATP-binding protein [Peribacillus muralis]AOH53550.1 ATPase [Peribacillus muralis]
MLEVRNLSKKFGNNVVLDDVSFCVGREEFICLLGESGSGKSTIAELLIGLHEPCQGEIRWAEDSINCTQYVYQNPDRSFNPFWSMEQSLLEPLLLQKHSKKAALKKITSMMDHAGLPVELLKNKPSQCSGGQKQRMAIIRALLCNPRLLIADEITSALDPQTERTIIELLKEFQSSYHMSVLYITHRIQAIEGVADRVLVLDKGSIVESGTADEVLKYPRHPYTKNLLEACMYFEKRKKSIV